MVEILSFQDLRTGFFALRGMTRFWLLRMEDSGMAGGYGIRPYGVCEYTKSRFRDGNGS